MPMRSMTRSPLTSGSGWSSPTTGGPIRSPRCTTPVSSSSSSGRGATIRSATPGTHDVVPDVFCAAGLLDGIGELRVRSARVDRTRQVVLRDHDARSPKGTFDAARGAVDIALTATRQVLDGASHAYGLCRPPGHHAPAAMYGGYCFFNNAAIAAHHVASTTGTRVTVLDVDYHHGNGTQQIFYGRDDVQYVSLHGDPARAYPYITGFADERGVGTGEREQPQRAARRTHRRRRLHHRLVTRLRDDRRVRPEHRSSCRSASTRTTPTRSPTWVSPPTGSVGRARSSPELARPTVVLQEGGYDVATLGDNARQWLLGLSGRYRLQLNRSCRASVPGTDARPVPGRASADEALGLQPVGGDRVGVFEFDAHETVELGELLRRQRGADLVDQRLQSVAVGVDQFLRRRPARCCRR